MYSNLPGNPLNSYYKEQRLHINNKEEKVKYHVQQVQAKTLQCIGPLWIRYGQQKSAHVKIRMTNKQHEAKELEFSKAYVLQLNYCASNLKFTPCWMTEEWNINSEGMPTINMKSWKLPDCAQSNKAAKWRQDRITHVNINNAQTDSCSFPHKHNMITKAIVAKHAFNH